MRVNKVKDISSFVLLGFLAEWLERAHRARLKMIEFSETRIEINIHVTTKDPVLSFS